MSTYRLPAEVRALVHARNALRARFASTGLQFTLDGNLVGDLGEAIAAELFGLTLVDQRGLKGIDARAADGRTVQVKATGGTSGFPFTHVDECADWLIALQIHWEAEIVSVVYNGTYVPAIEHLVAPWNGQKHVRVNRLRRLNEGVDPNTRLIALLPPIALA